MRSRSEWQNDADNACAEAQTVAVQYSHAKQELRDACSEEAAARRAVDDAIRAVTDAGDDARAAAAAERVLRQAERMLRKAEQRRVDAEKAVQEAQNRVDEAQSRMESLCEAAREELDRCSGVSVTDHTRTHHDIFIRVQEAHDSEEEFFRGIVRQVEDAIFLLTEMVESANRSRRESSARLGDSFSGGSLFGGLPFLPGFGDLRNGAGLFGGWPGGSVPFGFVTPAISGFRTGTLYPSFSTGIPFLNLSTNSYQSRGLYSPLGLSTSASDWFRLGTTGSNWIQPLGLATSPRHPVGVGALSGGAAFSVPNLSTGGTLDNSWWNSMQLPTLSTGGSVGLSTGGTTFQKLDASGAGVLTIDPGWATHTHHSLDPLDSWWHIESQTKLSSGAPAYEFSGWGNFNAAVDSMLPSCFGNSYEPVGMGGFGGGMGGGFSMGS
jgi:hypothetical protein